MWSKMTPVYLHKDKVVYIPKYIWKEPLREMRWKEPFVVISCLNKKVSLYDCVMLRYELIPFSVDWNTPLGRTPAEIVFLPWLILHDDRRKLVVFTLWLGLKHWRLFWPKQRIPHLRILYKKRPQLWLTSKLRLIWVFIIQYKCVGLWLICFIRKVLLRCHIKSQ